MKPLLFLEPNAVNFEFVDHYARRGDLPTFARLIERHGYARTSSETVYEHIEPWIQWFTVHTGKPFGEHQVFRLGDGGLGDLDGGYTVDTVKALAHLPVRLWDVGKAALGLQERDPESPMSVVGVSRVAGEISSDDEIEVGDRIAIVISLLAGVNLFLGMFNFVPLLPLDGGHIAGALHEAQHALQEPGAADASGEDSDAGRRLGFGGSAHGRSLHSTLNGAAPRGRPISELGLTSALRQACNHTNVVFNSDARR